MDSFSIEQWMTFFQERWFVIVGAVIVLILVVNMVKTVLKWLLVLAILAGVSVYGANYVDQIKEVGGQIVGEAKDKLIEEAVKLLAGGDTEYRENEDGSFTITKGSVSLEGRTDSSEVKISYMGQSITLQADEAIKALIEQAKQNGTP